MLKIIDVTFSRIDIMLACDRHADKRTNIWQQHSAVNTAFMLWIYCLLEACFSPQVVIAVNFCSLHCLYYKSCFCAAFSYWLLLL